MFLLQGSIVALIFCFFNGEVNKMLKIIIAIDNPVNVDLDLYTLNVYIIIIVNIYLCKVQSEIKKKWRRFLISRGRGISRRNTCNTVTSFMSRTRGGSLGSTTNSQESKDHPNQNGNCTRETSLNCFNEELHPLQKSMENGFYLHHNGSDEYKPFNCDLNEETCWNVEIDML